MHNAELEPFIIHFVLLQLSNLKFIKHLWTRTRESNKTLDLSFLCALWIRLFVTWETFKYRIKHPLFQIYLLLCHLDSLFTWKENYTASLDVHTALLRILLFVYGDETWIHIFTFSIQFIITGLSSTLKNTFITNIL